MKPKQTAREFFEREDVRRLQEIQKRNPPSGREHKLATAKIKQLAVEIGAGAYFEGGE